MFGLSVGMALACVFVVFIGATVQASIGIGVGMIASPVLALADPDFIPVAILLCVLPLMRNAWAASAVAGWFALFHGFAHGAEMPADATALGYTLGFTLATAGLHCAGIGLGLAIHRLLDRPAVSSPRV